MAKTICHLQQLSLSLDVRCKTFPWHGHFNIQSTHKHQSSLPCVLRLPQATLIGLSGFYSKVKLEGTKRAKGGGGLLRVLDQRCEYIKAKALLVLLDLYMRGQVPIPKTNMAQKSIVCTRVTDL